ncbi:MAG TPA: tetratricopeptide repeat protein [Xanthobacteraceae bacterium]|nr:tetratricopeptide repeat protein [Xanthobacteraceae bacterium]
MSRASLRATVPQSDAPPDLDRLVRKAVAAHQNGALGQADRLYRAALAHDPDHFDALHLLGSLSLQRGRLADAQRFLAAAVRCNPRAADARSDLGVAYHGAGDYAAALASHDAALAIEPGNAGYINRRAAALVRLGRSAEALAALDRILSVQPGHADALGNRGNVHISLNRPDAAIADYDAARRAAGDSAQILTNRAHALRRLDRLAEAVADLLRALKLRPDLAEAHFELALAQLALGDFASGWNEYEWRWATAAFAPSRRGFTSPQWNGTQTLAGRTVLLHAEQGLGDTMQFVRYAPLVAQRGANVILEVQPELVALLAGTPGVARVLAYGERLPPFDLHCPLMSLPRAFATNEATIPADIPHIRVPPETAARWADRLPAGPPSIGMVWAGRPTHHNDLNRSLPLASLAPLLRRGDLRFVSLQRDARAGDAAILRDLPNVIDAGPDLHDFTETAALISRLDAVVAVDTAVAHLAGALGKPLLLLLPHAADFRWLRGRDDSPWYPSARLLRQDKFGDWSGVLARLDAHLGEFTRGATA